MMQLRASKGLGDAIYLRAMVLHLLDRGEAVEVFTPWREVFADLPVAIRGLSECTGDEAWHHAKPCLHCRIVQAPDLFRMACLQAGITEPVPLELRWRPKNVALIERVRREARGRPVLVYQPPKKAANLNERLLRPHAEAFAAFLSERSDWFRVKVGAAPYVAPENHPPCDLDLFGRTSVSDAFDIATAADAFYGEPCFVTVLAEALDKPVTCMFSRRAIASGRVHICNMRPERLFHKPHLATAIYDEEVAWAS